MNAELKLNGVPSLHPLDTTMTSASERSVLALTLSRHFLRRSQRLRVGITKDLFIQAVTGIFSSDDLSLALAYGNTNAGLTTGGPAAAGGSTSGQAGGDGGIAIPIINFNLPGLNGPR